VIKRTAESDAVVADHQVGSELSSAQIASMAPGSTGASELRFSWPYSVTRMSSSILTPIPRSCAGTSKVRVPACVASIGEFSLGSARTEIEGQA